MSNVKGHVVYFVYTAVYYSVVYFYGFANLHLSN